MASFLVISYLTLFVSLLSNKIIGLQLFGVLQLAYFSLSQHSYLNLYLYKFIKLKITNGFNIPLFPEQKLLPQVLNNMGVSSRFLNNFNIMYFLIIVQLLISVSLYLIAKFSTFNKFQRFFRQGLTTLILFNCFNISFSAGIQFKYTAYQKQKDIVNTLFTIIALIISFLSIYILQFTKQEGFGQFKNKFKDSFINKTYISITILYRMCLGFYCAVYNQYEYSNLILLGISLIFCLYLITNLPFNDAYQNYRSGFCHLTMFVILLISCYYRIMKSNTPIQIKSYILFPTFVQVVMIAFTIIISLAALIYDIYLMINDKKIKQKIKDRKDSQQLSNQQKNMITDQSMISNQ